MVLNGHQNSVRWCSKGAGTWRCCGDVGERSYLTDVVEGDQMTVIDSHAASPLLTHFHHALQIKRTDPP